MLFPIKRILVCTDLSEQSDEVLKNAEIIRKQAQAELDVLYVSDIDLQLSWASPDSRSDTFYEVFVGNIAKDLKEKMNAQLKRTGAKGHKVFAQGSVAETINEKLTDKKVKYDLLIMGHNSKKGFVGHLMGSVARKIVTSAVVPTIIIKKEFSFDKIAGFIDDTQPENWMITSTLDFYRSLSFKKIEFVSLWHNLPEMNHAEKLFEAEKKFQEEVDYFIREGEKPLLRFEVTRDLKISEHLCEIIEEDKITLAVMKKNRGHKLNKMFIGSETMRMLEAETANLLILPVS